MPAKAKDGLLSEVDKILYVWGLMSKPTLKQIIQSVLAAAIGVQSNANRERDFEQGSLTSYLIVGAIATVLFIIILLTIVSFIL